MRKQLKDIDPRILPASREFTGSDYVTTNEMRRWLTVEQMMRCDTRRTVMDNAGRHVRTWDDVA